MIALKAYYDGHSFIPLEKKVFKPRQTAIIVIDEEMPVSKKKNCRGLASEYANLKLVEKEADIASMAFSGEK